MEVGEARSQRRRARVAHTQLGSKTAGFPPPSRRRAHLARQLPVGRHAHAQRRERFRRCRSHAESYAWGFIVERGKCCKE